MRFRVAARTLQHLGAELISSDVVALYELIKNAFDARSPRVEVRVVVRMPYERWRDLITRLRSQGGDGVPGGDPSMLDRIRTEASDALDATASDVSEVRQRLAGAQTLPALLETLAEANTIRVQDWGQGMSLDLLSDVFLTIGTRARLVERATTDDRPVLGEKGLGRLSAMRLGQRLRVETSQEGEVAWNRLDIDWSRFSHESDALLEDLDVDPHRDVPKADPKVSGTTLTISHLNAAWTKEKLEQLAREQFAKLTDPFATTDRYPVSLWFNDDPVVIPRFNTLLVEHAHGTVTAEFGSGEDGRLYLLGRVRYGDRMSTFDREGAHLVSSAGNAPLDVLRSLGPFDLTVYWYNRRLLAVHDPLGDNRVVAELVRQWGGGVMVYRDGFRVMPYGSGDDDWLDLDRKALASGGYKVNRAQLVGRVSIASAGNPALSDQTNREGLRDSAEKEALVALLRHVLEVEFRGFLNAIDDETRAREPINLDEVEQRVTDEIRRAEDSLRTLTRRYPAVAEDSALIEALRDAIRAIRDTMMEVSAMAESYEEGRRELLHLAGVGLMVEVVAHELNRATAHTLTILGRVTQPLPREVEKVFATLRAQLKTLGTRLKILDPLSTAGRQRKESFDLVALVRDTLAAHEAQFGRHHIRYELCIEPAKAKELRVLAVKGMVVQVLENLVSNAVYWLGQQRRLDRAFQPKLTVTINADTKEVRVTDNGPGVPPKLRETVFQAFYTTKPPGRGKGLGLFIAREIAKYHGATLELALRPGGPHGQLNTFVLALRSMAA